LNCINLRGKLPLEPSLHFFFSIVNDCVPFRAGLGGDYQSIPTIGSPPVAAFPRLLSSYDSSSVGGMSHAATALIKTLL
jgi:hypothetical protein